MRRGGFTLVEMMVAVGLTVLMMTMVVTVFGLVMDSIRESRGSIEITDRLRATQNRLALDLAGVTAPMTPPLDPRKDLGYFELIEGPIGPVISPTDVAKTDIPDSADPSGFAPDTTVGDLDDILMFTIRSNDEPFVGRMPVCTYDAAGPVSGNLTNITWVPAQSNVAEVAWFVRGTTLYRRIRLVLSPPNGVPLPTDVQLAAFGVNLYDYSDLSVHRVLEGTASRFVPNTLGDLTKRENRYAHQPFAWPYDARMWGGVATGGTAQYWTGLGLPTLEECTSGFWGSSGGTTVGSQIDPRGTSIPLLVPYAPPAYSAAFALADQTYCPRMQLSLGASEPFDAWRRPNPATEQDRATGQLLSAMAGSRVGEDVILTNVLSYDVKVWDPGAPIVTLNDSTETINGEAIQPGDPAIREPDGSGGFYDWPAIIYALQRVFTNNGGSDLDKIVGFGAYVDLNYLCRMGQYRPWVPNYIPSNFTANMVPLPPSLPQPQFHHAGDIRSGLFGTAPQFAPNSSAILIPNRRPAVYDTYSNHYESDGIAQANVPYFWRASPPWPASPWLPDAAVNGLDDNGNGAVDETTAWPNFDGENETAPPYAHPLRGIQIKIRVFEPDTRLIREVTVEHEFIPQ